MHGREIWSKEPPAAPRDHWHVMCLRMTWWSSAALVIKFFWCCMCFWRSLFYSFFLLQAPSSRCRFTRNPSFASTSSGFSTVLYYDTMWSQWHDLVSLIWTEAHTRVWSECCCCGRQQLLGVWCWEEDHGTSFSAAAGTSCHQHSGSLEVGWGPHWQGLLAEVSLLLALQSSGESGWWHPSSQHVWVGRSSRQHWCSLSRCIWWEM